MVAWAYAGTVHCVAEEPVCLVRSKEQNRKSPGPPSLLEERVLNVLPSLPLDHRL